MPDKTIMPDRNNTPNRSRSHDPDRKALIPKGPRLADLHGMSAAKTWGEALAQDLEDYIAGRITWSEVDPGALLHGDPGTGKTMFAKALAATCGVPLIATSYAGSGPGTGIWATCSRPCTTPSSARGGLPRRSSSSTRSRR
jgi:hypothetical protein